MADNLHRRQPEDKRFINLNEPWEVSYWTQALGVTEAKLRQAVAAAGSGTAKVRAYLGK